MENVNNVLFFFLVLFPSTDEHEAVARLGSYFDHVKHVPRIIVSFVIILLCHTIIELGAFS